LKVGVIGLGTMGSMALWQLAKKGVTVEGFEQFGIGHDRSAVGGESRLFRTAYREGAQYVPLLRNAKELWRELEAESGNQLLNLCGGLTIGKHGSDNMKNVLKSIQEYNIDHEIFSTNEARKLFPQHRLNEDDVVILDKESGFLRPELAVVSAVSQAVKLGASIHKNVKITQIESTINGVVIHANGNKYEFDQVIVSAGSWVKELIPEFQHIIEPKRIIMSWFIPESLPEFKVNHYPTFVRTVDTYDFFGLPTIDQSMVKIAMVGSEEPIGSPDSLDHNITTEEISDIVHIVENYFNHVHPDPVRLSAHMDAYTPDEHAIVGQASELPNILVMTGFSGHGFKMAPVMGKIAADLILDGNTMHNINHFNPARFIRNLGGTKR